MWGVVQLSTTGKLITEETCTQRLQTFHKAKKLAGSPCKTQDLSLGSADLDYDPRPDRFVNATGYPSFVRNLVLNYNNRDPMPIEMTIEPANPYAITLDHTYSSHNLEDQFLMNNNITQISPSEAEIIQKKTLKQGNSKVWQSERCKRLTASNFGRICNATHLTNFENLAYSLTKYTKVTSPSIRHGVMYESTAIGKFEKHQSVITQNCGLFISLTHPYIAATPDGLLGDDTCIEVKCPYSAKDQIISSVSVPWLKQDADGELKLDRKHAYFYQIQGQLFCTGRMKSILIVYTLKDVKYFEIERDNVFISDMVAKLTEFYEQYFKKAILRRFLYKDYYGYSFQPTNVF